MIRPADDPAPEPRHFAEALLAGTHKPSSLAAEFITGYEEPVSLHGLTALHLEDLRGRPVIVTPAIESYLSSGDKLTNAILDNAELALETHYLLPHPFYITARRSGSEAAGTLKAEFFYLDREERV